LALFPAISGETAIARIHGHEMLISDKIFIQRMIIYSTDSGFGQKLLCRMRKDN